MLESIERTAQMEGAGFRFGARGTHSSRTLMLSDLAELFSVLPCDAGRSDYSNAVIAGNILGKRTYATRKASRQRLSELYGLDLRIPLFRVMRHLWQIDKRGRPLLALFCALARDPLLRLTAQPVLKLPIGGQLARADLLNSLGSVVGSRMNHATLDKIARNSASSWTQSNHLCGRVRKVRRRANPTAGLSHWPFGSES